METLQEGGFSNLVTQLKAFFFPKSGGDVSGSVTATGKVKAATIEDSDGTLGALRESVSELSSGDALPVMSSSNKGGAKLGSGLSVDGDALNLGPLTASGSGASVQTDGSGIFGVTGEGWAEQDTTAGKNLVDVADRSGTVSSAYYVDTATDFTLVEGETYTLSLDATSTVEPFRFTVGCGPTYFRHDIADVYNANSGRVSITFTPTASDLEYGSRFYIRIPRYATQIAFTYSMSKVQLELGSTPTAYEPYTGGIPSPSPDYPQEIRVARGRNLLDGDTESVTLASSGNFYPYRATKLQAGKTYTVSFASSINSGAWQVLANNAAGTGGQTILATVNFATAKTATFTPAQDFSYLALFSNTGGTFEDIQLELGSTPTPYVPYGHVGLEVRAVAGLYKENILYSGSGAEESNTVFDAYSIGATEGTYYALVSATHGNYFRAFAFDKSGKVLATLVNVILSLGENTFMMRVPEGTAEIRYSAHRTNAVVKIATTTPIPLPAKGFAGALPDGTVDALEIDSAGRWEWVNNADEVVFDGSSDEEWGIVSGYESLFKIDNVIPDATKAKPNSLSSHFARTISAAASMTSGQYKADISGTNQRLLYKYTDVSTVADWTTWLASNNVTLLYPLATPTTEHGYIELPELPAGATVSIPELEAIGVEWWVNGAEAIAEHGRDVSKANKEQEDRIAELEAAVANLATS